MGMVMRAALVVESTGLVETVAVIGDGYIPPPGFVCIVDPPLAVCSGWIYSEGEWSLPPKPVVPIETLRLEAHALRRERRTQAELAGFTYADHPLDSDRDSILRIANAAASAISSILGQQPWIVLWRCADEFDMPLDAAGMLALQGALALHGQACHTVSQEIGAEIEAAETTDAVDQIIASIPTDPRWPA
jgi:hypothetical protein